MRTEQIIKESEFFANKDECYLHCEKVSGGVYNVVIVGDPLTIVSGIFTLIKNLCDERNIPFRVVLRTLKRLNRRVKPSVIHFDHEDSGSEI